MRDARCSISDKRPERGTLTRTTHSSIFMWEERNVLRRATIGGVFDRHHFACCQRKQRASTEEVRYRCNRYRDKDRKHHAVQRSLISLCTYWADRSCLLQKTERRRGHQRQT